MEWFQQRKAGKVQKVLLDACKRKQRELKTEDIEMRKHEEVRGSVQTPK